MTQSEFSIIGMYDKWNLGLKAVLLSMYVCFLFVFSVSCTDYNHNSKNDSNYLKGV